MSMRTISAAALLLAAIAFAAMDFASTGSVPGYLFVLAWGGVFALTGAVLAIRRPANPIGWLFLVIALAAEGSSVARNGGPVDPAGGPASILRLITVEAWVVPYGLLPVLLILFPTGRPPTRRWWIPIIAAALIIPTSVLSSTDAGGTSILSILFGSGTAPLADPLQTFTGVGLMGLYFVAVASLFRRRRSASAEERQQLKWVAYAGAILAIAFVGTSVAFFSPLRELDPDAAFPVAMFGGVPFVTGLIAVPIAVGVAVLRYRLYEIDALISRTLVYGSLTAVLVLAYVAGVAAFQLLLSPFTSGSPIAVAVSTLAVVALFQPLRRRIQSAVDHRFFRAKYDAERTLDAFAARLRDEVDLASLERELVGVVNDTMQPVHASVWLREAKS
jgi:hypothetical protein